MAEAQSCPLLRVNDVNEEIPFTLLTSTRVNEEILLTLLTSTRVNEGQREMSTTTRTRGGASTRVNEKLPTGKEGQRGMDLLTLNERFSTSHQQLDVNEEKGNVNEERQRETC